MIGSSGTIGSIGSSSTIGTIGSSGTLGSIGSSGTIGSTGGYRSIRSIGTIGSSGSIGYISSIGRAVARPLIGGCIFIYSGRARLVSFEIKLISTEVSRAEPECMNIHPPPN